MGPLPPTAYRYRPLKRGLEGWDVYALQSTLAGIPGFDGLEVDGSFGQLTETAVLKFQSERQMTTDAIAGIATQQKLASVIARKFRKGWNLPNGIPYGHIEAESGGILGNHTAQYSNGSYDCGIVQRNTAYAPMLNGFDAPDSLMALCEQISTYRDRYIDFGLVSAQRALELACGSWNRPAWTDRLAQGGVLKPAESDWIEGYISRVTAYL